MKPPIILNKIIRYKTEFNGVLLKDGNDSLHIMDNGSTFACWLADSYQEGDTIVNYYWKKEPRSIQ
jgi:hypothetical protein